MRKSSGEAHLKATARGHFTQIGNYNWCWREWYYLYRNCEINARRTVGFMVEIVKVVRPTNIIGGPFLHVVHSIVAWLTESSKGPRDESLGVSSQEWDVGCPTNCPSGHDNANTWMSWIMNVKSAMEFMPIMTNRRVFVWISSYLPHKWTRLIGSIYRKYTNVAWSVGA